MIYIVYLAIILCAFLIVLNGYLHGAAKAKIDAALGLLLVALLVAAWSTGGWKHAVGSVSVAFLGAILLRPFAARVAAGILGMSSSSSRSYIGLPPSRLEQISRQLDRPIDPRRIIEQALEHDREKQALLDYCESQPEIRAIMLESGVSRAEMLDLYGKLVRAGACQWRGGHWVAASALGYPNTLQYVLRFQRWETLEERTEMVYNLLMHFEQGQPLPLLSTRIDV